MPEYLKAVRLDFGFSRSEVSTRLKMPVKILQALEEGYFQQLPSAVYVKGFLGRLAELYKIDPNPLTKQFEIERRILAGLTNQPKAYAVKAAWFLESWVITPKNLGIAVAAVFAGLTIVYVIWQVLAIGQVPFLEIDSPQDMAVVEKSFVEISGRTDPGAILSVNNQPVFVDSEGKFSSQLSLSSGPKELVIVASNRFNKSASRTLNIIGQNQTLSDNDWQVRLELEFTADMEIGYRIDGASEVKTRVRAGEAKLLEAKTLLFFSVPDAGGVKAKVNGRNFGFLGRPGEKLTDIPFSAESGNIK